MIYKKILSLILCVSMVFNTCAVSHASNICERTSKVCGKYLDADCMMDNMMEKFNSGDVDYILESNLGCQKEKTFGYFSFTNSSLHKFIEYITPEMTAAEFNKFYYNSVKSEETIASKRNKIFGAISFISTALISVFLSIKLNKVSEKEQRKVSATKDNNEKKSVNKIKNTVDEEKLIEDKKDNNKNSSSCKNKVPIKTKIMNAVVSFLGASIISFLSYGLSICVADSLYKSNVPDLKFYDIYDSKLSAVSSLLDQIKYGLWKYSNGISLNYTDPSISKDLGYSMSAGLLSPEGIEYSEDEKNKLAEVMEIFKEQLQSVIDKYSYDRNQL